MKNEENYAPLYVQERYYYYHVLKKLWFQTIVPEWAEYVVIFLSVFPQLLCTARQLLERRFPFLIRKTRSFSSVNISNFDKLIFLNFV